MAAARVRKRKDETAEQIMKRLMQFGEQYDVQNDADFLECAGNYAAEAELIAKMRALVEAEGLTVMKSYKTGDQPVAHPLIPEIAKHVDCANRTLAVMREIVETRGARKEETSDLARFRIS